MREILQSICAIAGLLLLIMGGIKIIVVDFESVSGWCSIIVGSIWLMDFQISQGVKRK